MKTRITGIQWLIPLMFTILVTLPAWADVPVNATLETAGISSMTGLDCEGTVTHTNMLAWEQSGSSLHDPPLNAGGFYTVWFDRFGNPVYGWTADPALAALLGEPIPQGEVRYTAAYSAGILASQGTIHVAREVAIDTAGKATDQENIAVTTHLAFRTGSGTGRVTSDENLLVDAAGTHTTGESTTLCPFANGESPFIPPFCNVVEMGSSVDLTEGSISTSADARFVSESNNVPVTMDYSIAGGGVSSSQNSAYATGSMCAYLDAHLQEGRMVDITPFNPDAPPDTPRGFVPVQATDAWYSESTSTKGAIGLFWKEMRYQSGI